MFDILFTVTENQVLIKSKEFEGFCDLTIDKNYMYYSWVYSFLFLYVNAFLFKHVRIKNKARLCF